MTSCSYILTHIYYNRLDLSLFANNIFIVLNSELLYHKNNADFSILLKLASEFAYFISVANKPSLGKVLTRGRAHKQHT